MADVLLTFWSGTGNTEIMAEKIKEGIEKTGTKVDYKPIYKVNIDDVSNYNKLIFGCPAMGVENLEEDEFEPFFNGIEKTLQGKKIALFGSYGWGDGEWMDIWQEHVKEIGAILYDEGFKINSTPSGEEEESCIAFGEAFAKF